MKILRKSISVLISASTIICACPQTYAKINIDKQKIVNSAKTVGKYIAPLSAALATGLIIGAGYGKYQDYRINKRSHQIMDNQVPYGQPMSVRCAGLNTLNAMKKIDQSSPEIIAEEIYYSIIYNALTDSSNDTNNIAEQLRRDVSFKKGDKVLIIGEIDGKVFRLKEMLFKAIEHILKDDGKVVFLGNMVSKSMYSRNLECILPIIELKYKFPSNVLILSNDNEQELLRDKERLIPIDARRQVEDDLFRNVRDLVCNTIARHTSDSKIINNDIYCGKIHDTDLLNSGKKIFTLNKIISDKEDSSICVLDSSNRAIICKNITID